MPAATSRKATKVRDLSLSLSIPIQNRIERLVLNPGAMTWSISDQALISASNFALMLLVARATSPAGFGAFVLVYTGLLFVNSIQAALVTGPHNVLGAQKSGADYQRYTTSLLILQVIGSLGAGAIAGIVVLLFRHFVSIERALIVLLPCAIIGWQIQELTRRVLYTEGNYRGAFLTDLVTYGGQIVMVIALYFASTLNGVSALTTIAAASSLGACVGVWMIRGNFSDQVAFAQLRSAGSENLMFGKWLLGSSILSWTSIYFYPILTAGFIGVAATGGIRAVQNLVSPTHVLLKTMESTLPSRTTQAYEAEGKVGAWAYLRKSSAPILLLLILYCILVSLASRMLVEAILGASFSSYWWFVPVFALSYTLVLFSTVADILLRSLGGTRSIFSATLLSTIVVLTAGIWLVVSFGLSGVAIGMILHGVILNACLWIAVRRELAAK